MNRINKMYIWEFKQGTGGTERFSCYDVTRHDVVPEYYSSFTKCRKEVKRRVKEQCLSRENWTEENWKSDDYCVIINSGGNSIFSIKRIEVK